MKKEHSIMDITIYNGEYPSSFCKNPPNEGEICVNLLSLGISKDFCRKYNKIISRISEKRYNIIEIEENIVAREFKNYECHECMSACEKGVELGDSGLGLCYKHLSKLSNVLEVVQYLDVDIIKKGNLYCYKYETSKFELESNFDEGEYMLKLGDIECNLEEIEKMQENIKKSTNIPVKYKEKCCYCRDIIEGHDLMVANMEEKHLFFHSDCKDKLIKNVEDMIYDMKEEIISCKLS